MSSAGSDFPRDFELPWTRSVEQERRYRRIQIRSLLLIALLSLLFWRLPMPEAPREELVPPPRPIQLVMEQRPPLPPETVPLAKPEPQQPEVQQPVKPVPQSAAKPQIQKPQALHEAGGNSAPPGPSAQDRAKAAGISQLADLASLQDSAVASKAITGRPDLTGPPNPNFTSDLSGGQDRGPGSERSLITSKAGEGSGGVNTAAMSRGYGSGGLAGRGTTLVEGYGGGGDGSGPGVGRGGSGHGVGGGGGGHGTGSGNGEGSGHGKSRSREEIEEVFDRNKGVLYAIYNRALRDDPGLRGKVVLSLTIAPDGTVTGCDVVSSELTAQDLLQKLVLRVKQFKFSAEDVPPITATKPLDFFPESG